MATSRMARTEELDDDTTEIQPGDRVVMVIENDVAVARLVLERAHEHDLKVRVLTRGLEAVDAVRQQRPQAIVLDVGLLDVDGWRVLDRLKHDPDVRHIPVYLITCADDRVRGLRLGAAAVLTDLEREPEALDRALEDLVNRLQPRVYRVLLADADETVSDQVRELVGGDDVLLTVASTVQDVLNAVAASNPDLLIVGRLADAHPIEVVQQLCQDPANGNLPVIVYSYYDPTREQEVELQRMVRGHVLKDVRSPQRLVDETALFLHRELGKMLPQQREAIEKLYSRGDALAGKRVLVIDDDIRNIFAVSSVLERCGIDVVSAERGPDGLEILRGGADFDAVLIDIMMPEMDGYEVLEHLRGDDRFYALPVIALTAKAMKGDREKCLEAGASDYIAKPVDANQLLNVLTSWMYR
jgi:CheY-like chemotaxis protein